LAWSSFGVMSALAAASLCLTGCAGTNATPVPGFGSIFTPQGSAPAQVTSVKPETPAPEPERTIIEPKKTRAAESEFTCGQPEACLARLKGMTADPDRRWIRQPESPAAQASGVRLFAYAALRKKLTCEELALALAEIKRTGDVFQGSVPGVRPENAASVTALNARVGEELRTESARRCAQLQTTR
jgi:hypothetical protein